MTHVADETKVIKFFRFLHGVSERALKGSLDVEQFAMVGQVLLDKGARATNLLEYVAKGCPKVDYTKPVLKAKTRQQKSSPLVVDLDAEPFVPDGWKVEEHTKGGQFSFDTSKVKFHFDDGQKNDKYIQGHKLRTQLKDVSVMNANLLDWYLAHPEHIPEDWKGKAVFFWGTVYRRRDGNSCVRFLCWNGGQWFWNARWLGNDWNGFNPVLVRVIT